MMVARPCLDCGRITTHGNRCPTHARATARARHRIEYDTRRWRFRRSVVLVRHRRRWGEVCPGWNRKPHLASRSNPLTVDHRVPIYAGGTDDWDNLQVLCLQCNGRKDA